MSFTKRARAWFFRSNAPLNAENKKINFQDNQRPDQGSFEELTASHLNFSEAGDRAKINTGAAISAEVGTVAVTSNVKAKANTTGFESDRTLVTHAGQLPTSQAGAAQAITGTNAFNDVALAVADDGTATRNNFLSTLSTNFLAWLNTLNAAVDTNTADIAALGTPASAPAWSSLPSTSIVLYYAGGGTDLVDITSVAVTDWDSSTGTRQSYLDYYIIGDVIHFSFRFDFKLAFTPLLSAPTGGDANIRIGISPPSGATFVLRKGGSCLRSWDEGDNGKGTAINIGAFDANDDPLLVATHVDENKIFFARSVNYNSTKVDDTVRFTGEFTAQLA